MLNNGGKEMLKELYTEILKAETEEEIGEFLEDLCTIKELESMSQRLKAAKMLLQGKKPASRRKAGRIVLSLSVLCRQ